MVMSIKKLCVVIVGLLLWPFVWADQYQPEEAKQWLERMLQAAQNLNYEGTFVYSQGQNLEAMHILHRNDSDGEQQRMISLNGAVREVLVADNKVICLLPQERVAFDEVKHNRSLLPFSLPRELDKLEDYYRFALLGEDRIAGMEARIIAIQPQDELRFGYRLWLERDTAMLLRSTLLDETGGIVEQLMFTRLQIKPEIDAALLSPQEVFNFAMPLKTHPMAETVERSPWQVVELPLGFVQILHNRYARGSSEHPTEHMVFTDGLATVSVFLDQLEGQPLLVGASQMGAMNAFGVVIEDHQGLVVGEVPKITVKMIAESLQYHEEAATQ